MTSCVIRSISVGLPKEVDMNGQIVTSAILKEPVDGPVRLSSSGLDGDKPAVHPDAVYVFTADDYQFWAEQLGDEWRDGFFGENFTIEGLNQDKLCVGDLIEIGQSARMQVLGPRVPCFKLAWRLGMDDSFLRQFALSGHTGFYCSVLSEGLVRIGDPVRMSPGKNRHSSVNHIAKLNWQIEEPSEKELVSALATPALSKTSELPLRNRLVRIQDRRRTTTGRWSGWREFLVTKVTDESDDVRSLTLVAADEDALCGYRPGQFVTVEIRPRNGKSITRTYSISDYSDEPQDYRITVKRLDGGSGSTMIHDSLDTGSSVYLQAPVGNFVLDRTNIEPLVLIGAGIGITPIISMAKAHFLRGPSAPMMYLINCVRDSDAHVLVDELEDLAAQSPRIALYNIYSKPLSGDNARDTDECSRRLTLERLTNILSDTFVDYCGTKIPVPWTVARFYLCGPASFQDEVTRWLADAGVDASHINIESFDPRSGEPIGGVVTTAQVRFAQSDKTVEWEISSGLSLLELAELHGLNPASGCRFGACSTCKCKLLEGEAHYDHAPVATTGPDEILPCCATPGSQEIVIDL